MRRSRLLLAGILAGLALTPHGQRYEPVYVQWGDIAYSSGRKLKSNSFKECSALILDYGNEALMVHVFPRIVFHYPYIGIDDKLAVYVATEEMKHRGIDPKRVGAVLSAGSQESHNNLMSDLKKAGIKIKQSSINGAERDITYDPVRDKTDVDTLTPAFRRMFLNDM